MFMHPTVAAALAEQRRHDLTDQAEAYRAGRDARLSSGRRSAHPAALPRLFTAARQLAARLPVLTVSAREAAGRECG